MSNTYKSKKNNVRNVYVVIKHNGLLVLESCHHKDHLAGNYFIVEQDIDKVAEGDVIVSYQRPIKRYVQVSKKIGSRGDIGLENLISSYQAGLKMQFTKAALKEVKNMQVPELRDREDLRNVPLVTIDPDSARDYDDAIFAEKITQQNIDRIINLIGNQTDIKNNPLNRQSLIGGYYMLSAIADVAYYVRPGSALDREAKIRGNSTYFPDMVVPMLPEELSNNLCSLVPNEDRACMAFHMIVNNKGELVTGKVSRALMKSAARLTYGQVQKAIDGKADKQTAPLLENVLKPLYEAGYLCQLAKEARGALCVDSKEYAINFNDKSEPVAVKEKVKYQSNKIVEAFALMNNQLIGEVIGQGIFRNHPEPRAPYAAIKLVDKINLSLSVKDKIKYDAKNISPDTAVIILQQVRKNKKVSAKDKALLEEEILKCQRPAEYSTNNIGHSGLRLKKYVHGTSDIRRNPDLENHRILIGKFGLGEGGISKVDLEELERIARRNSVSERMSDMAQSEAQKRHLAKYYERYIGKKFKAQVKFICGNGIGVRVDGTLAGILPLKHLVDGRYLEFDSDKHILYNRKEGKLEISRNQKLKVRLIKSDSVTGKITFRQIPSLSQQFRIAAEKVEKLKDKLDNYLYDNCLLYRNSKNKKKSVKEHIVK